MESAPRLLRGYRALPRTRWWISDDAALIVDFGDAGTAIGVVVGDVTRPPPTLTERIRRWLGL
jgi:hypothetical protein